LKNKFKQCFGLILVLLANENKKLTNYIDIKGVFEEKIMSNYYLKEYI